MSTIAENSPSAISSPRFNNACGLVASAQSHGHFDDVLDFLKLTKPKFADEYARLGVNRWQRFDGITATDDKVARHLVASRPNGDPLNGLDTDGEAFRAYAAFADCVNDDEPHDRVAIDGKGFLIRLACNKKKQKAELAPHQFDVRMAADWLAYMGLDHSKVPLLLKDKDAGTAIPCDGLYSSLGQIKALHDHKGLRLFALLHPTDGNGRTESNIKAVRGLSFDFDKGRPKALAVEPMSYVQTRPGRFQLHFMFDRDIAVAHAKHIMTEFGRLHAGDGEGQCDPNALRVTQPFRLPGSVTHIDGEVYRVEDIAPTGNVISPEDFAEAFGLPPYVVPQTPTATIEQAPACTPAIVVTNGGLRGRIEAAAPFVRLNTYSDQQRGAYYLKNAAVAEEWGFEAFHIACKASDKYQSEAQCRKVWESQPLKGLDPEAAAAFFFSRAKGRADLSAISRANPSGSKPKSSLHCDALPSFSINPKGWSYVEKARYGSARWLDLSLPARAVHDAMHASHYQGRNNGRLVPDVIALANAVGLDKRTVAKAIKELTASDLWRWTMEPTGSHPGLIEVADAGTQPVTDADGKMRYSMPARVQWANEPRAKDAGAPMLHVIRIENSRFGSKAWTSTSAAGQEIVKAIACMKVKDDPSEIVSPTRAIVNALTGISCNGFSGGMSSAEGAGLVVVISRAVRGDGLKSFARAGKYRLVAATEAKARPARKSDELRKSKGKASSMVAKKASESAV